MTTSHLKREALRHALTRLGWAESGTFRDKVEYWEPGPAIDVKVRGPWADQLVLPMRDDAPDTTRLLEQAAEHLRLLIGPDFDRVLETVSIMSERHLDEVEVRLDTEDAGVIPWLQGNEIIDNTRAMLSAAAKASSRKQKRYFNAEAFIAEEFLDQCLMGQTKVGSYIVTALTPAAGSLATSRSKNAEDTKHPRIPTRSVTRTLEAALRAVQESVRDARGQDGKLVAFDEAVEQGVSYELLAALEPVTQRVESEIAVDYLVNPMVVEPTEQPTVRFSFTPEDGLVIARAREHFDAPPVPKLARLVGEVTLLKNSSAKTEHQVKLSALVDESVRVVTVSLSADQYAKALKAHDEKRMFRVEGTLELGPRKSSMFRPSVAEIEDTSVNVIMEKDETEEPPQLRLDTSD